MTHLKLQTRFLVLHYRNDSLATSDIRWSDSLSLVCLYFPSTTLTLHMAARAYVVFCLSVCPQYLYVILCTVCFSMFCFLPKASHIRRSKAMCCIVRSSKNSQFLINNETSWLFFFLFRYFLIITRLLFLCIALLYIYWKCAFKKCFIFSFLVFTKVHKSISCLF